MKDIARLAKVSTSTVSHVINGSRFVSEEILENSTFGGYLATTLIEAGHQNIGIITDNLKKSVAKNRLEGDKKALSETKIPLNNDWIIESHFNFEGGLPVCKNYLRHHTAQPPYFVVAIPLELLLQQIKNPDEHYQTLTLNPHVVVRQSILKITE